LVSTTYAVSDQATFDLGATVASGAAATATVTMAVEGVPSATIYTTTVRDVQDGCLPPSFATATSETSANTTTTGDEVEIRSPFGDFVNPDFTPTEDDVVVIGARDTSKERQATPGVIFAECDEYPNSEPGLVYDTDVVTLFWSWYAKTPEQVQDHIDNAIYEIGVFDSQPFQQPVIVSDIQLRDGDYWVFYTITLGNVKPAGYPVEFKLSWERAISDGYADFGPGTANERVNSTCTFVVTPNPEGKTVRYTFP
ncbi:MAG: hypothetical protein H7Y11_07940, partial [Armatimonadetes bacterium]|nr:hypothetical protein [Anaerolineae bacterium]